MDNKPNFSEFTYDELLDAEKHIDKDIYPERYEAVIKLLNDPEHLPQPKKEFAQDMEVSKYSTFWPRFWAAAIDGILFALLLYIECLIFGVEYSAQDKFLQALNGVQFALYAIFMHGYFGQTLGKMVMGVKVLNHDTETKINVKQALRRESVNLALNIAWVLIILTVAATLEMTGTISVGLSYTVIGFGILAIVWGVSEFVTMLFNDKRRAIHDYIGKTVVVRT
ncbi:RDD family protein [Pseudoalteromonas luteoviolacea]|uniref:RDD family protein n=1 Tax=Pseudoalteromonas luteoviolacea TaxID=43657 RepID=UPI00114D562A|nr:RDD family protein [Pseudoalteromonas luteoviolacea]TQF70136.1 RDD family protein [Pseudoalteromonas luteoviolacea]